MRLIKKTARVLLIGLTSLLIFLVILWGILQTNWGQDIVRKRLVSYLEKKIGTQVVIGKIKTNWLSKIEIDQVLLQDQSNKLMLQMGTLKINYTLLDFFDQKISISRVSVDTLFVRLSKAPSDSIYNFQYIINAFSEKPTTNAEEGKTNTSYSWQVGDLDIRQLKFLLDDQHDQQFYNISTDSLFVSMQQLDIDKQEYFIKKIFTNGLTADINSGITSNQAKVNNATATLLPFIKVDSIQLNNNKLNIDIKDPGFLMYSVIKKISSTGLQLNLHKNHLQLSKLLLQGDTSKINWSVNDPTSIKPATPVSTTASQPFTFFIGNVEFAHQQLKLDQQHKPVTSTKQLDYHHLALQQIRLIADSIKYDGKAYKVNLRKFNASDQSGFSIKKLQGGFTYSEQALQLKALLVVTDNSQLSADIFLQYPSLLAVQKNRALVNINTQVYKGYFSKKDFALLGLNQFKDPYVKKIMAQDISVKGKVKGEFSQLTLADIQVKLAGMDVNFSGTINGLPNPQKLNAAITFNRFSGSREGLESLLPPGTIPANIALPNQFIVKGKVSGKHNDININLSLNSSDGNLLLNGRLIQLKEKEKIAYDLKVASSGLQLGKILKDTLLGFTNFNLLVKGKGIDLQQADAQLSGYLPSVYLNGYAYKNIALKTSIQNQLTHFDVAINDPAAIAHVTGKYSFDSSYPILQADAIIDMLDPRALGFVKDTLMIKTAFHGNFTSINSKHINGQIQFPFVELNTQGKIWLLDSAFFRAVNVDSLQQINVDMPFVKLRVDGQYEMDALGDITKQLLLNYLVKDPIKKIDVNNANALVELEITDHPILHALFPDLSSFKKLDVTGQIDTRTNHLTMVGTLPYLQYQDYKIDSSTLHIASTSDSLMVQVVTNGIQLNAYDLHQASLTSTIKNGVFNWNADLYKSTGNIFYQLKGHLVNDSAHWLVELHEKQLLNSEYWQVSKNNIVKIPKNTSGFFANIELNNAVQKLGLHSAATNSGFPLQIDVNEFPISTFTKLVSTDTAFVDGKINGTASIIKMDPFSFTSALKVDSLKSYNSLIGNIELNSNYDSTGKGYFADLILSGNNNAAKVSVNYGNNGELNGNVNIDSINVKILNPFLQKYFSSTSGKVKGALDIKGKFPYPSIIGSITAMNVKGVYTDYNTYFNLPSGKIDFTKDGLRLNNLEVKDSAGNTAFVNGQLLTSNYLDYKYDLSIKTTHFLVAGKKQRPQQALYGPAWITADMKIGSKNEILLITGNVTADEKSEINFEMDDADVGNINADGIIEYYDAVKQFDSSALISIKKENFFKDAALKMDINLNLAINKTSVLKIILDKTGGDYLKASGDASLTLTMSADGKMNLFGEYKVESGEYILTLNEFIKRKFIIQKGGTIRWNSNPYDAVMDLTTVNTVTTTVEPLISGSQNIDKNAYKQKVPFDIYLTLKNNMTKPTIGFKIDMKEKDQNIFEGAVYTRIKQINLEESELNKQVMGLLVLNAFIAQDPLSRAATGFSLDVESAARVTAGKMLAKQLNSLASELLKDFDINFDLDSRLDYSSGKKVGQTDLSVNVSKSLFDDRTIVTIGSTIALEGSEEHKNESSGFADNASVEYKITRDGRYRVKIYRKNQFETAVVGQVVQSGVSFVLFIDYDHFKEIFQSHKKKSK